MAPTYTMLPARVKDACKHLSPDGESVTAHTAVALLTLHQRVTADGGQLPLDFKNPAVRSVK